MIPPSMKLNLMKQARPCWIVPHHRDGTVSVIPSVRPDERAGVISSSTRVGSVVHDAHTHERQAISGCAKRLRRLSAASAAMPRCPIHAMLRDVCQVEQWDPAQIDGRATDRETGSTPAPTAITATDTRCATRVER